MTVSQVPSLVSFTTGTVISSANVNSNYGALRTAFNALVTADNTVASGLTIPSPTLSGTVAGTPTWGSTQSLNTSGNAATASSCSGNAATATALATARAINGVDFDGTAAITVTAAAGTLTGTTLNGTVVASSLTSVGTLTSLTIKAGSGSGSGSPVLRLTTDTTQAANAGTNRETLVTYTLPANTVSANGKGLHIRLWGVQNTSNIVVKYFSLGGKDFETSSSNQIGQWIYDIYLTRTSATAMDKSGILGAAGTFGAGAASYSAGGLDFTSAMALNFDVDAAAASDFTFYGWTIEYLA